MDTLCLECESEHENSYVAEFVIPRKVINCDFLGEQ
jgi:hypothetical protein